MRRFYLAEAGCTSFAMLAGHSNAGFLPGLRSSSENRGTRVLLVPDSGQPG
jgi:hypothetical protein